LASAGVVFIVNVFYVKNLISDAEALETGPRALLDTPWFDVPKMRA